MIQVHDRLQEIFRDILDIPDLEIKSEMTAADVKEWDSLSHIQLIVSIEKAFKVRFKTAEVAGLKNVGQMISLLESKVTPN